MTIEELDLSVRSYNCLKRAGINTVEELTEKTEDDMMKVRNLGKKIPGRGNSKTRRAWIRTEIKRRLEKEGHRWQNTESSEWLAHTETLF